MLNSQTQSNKVKVLDQNESVSKPMVSYNNSSTIQLEMINKASKLIDIAGKYLKNLQSINIHSAIVSLLKNSGDIFTVVDFACSHGKNSMTVINQIFDQLYTNRRDLTKKLKEIIVYHNDLPENDFDEVARCVEDAELGYKYHDLIKSNQIELDTKCIRKSYYESIVSSETVNFAFCYTSLHWMPEYRDFEYGLVYSDKFKNVELKEWFDEMSHKYLLKWLNLRYEELKPSGLLSINIALCHSFADMINKVWNSFLKLKTINQSELSKVTIPVYARTEEQISQALSSIEGKFEVVNRNYIETTSGFDKSAFKAIFYNQMVSGLSNYPEMLPDIQSINKFYDDFVDEFFKTPNSSTFLSQFEWILLQKK